MRTDGHRLESLSVDDGIGHVICGYLSLPLPSSKRLAIDYRGGPRVFNEAGHGPLFGGERPAFRELFLKRFHLPLDTMRLDELRSFKAEVGWHSTAETSVETLLLLSRAPLLERFAYIETDTLRRRARPEHPVPSGFTPPESPPRIKKLELTCFSTALMNSIFRSVVPHPIGVKTVVVTCGSRTSDPNFRALGCFMNSLLDPVETFRLELSFVPGMEDYLDLKFGPVHIRFLDVLAHESVEETLDSTFGTSFAEVDPQCRAAVKSVGLNFQLSAEGLPMKILSLVNDAFPNVSHLLIRGIRVDTASNLLKAFSSAPSALLPSMEEMHIDIKIYDMVDDGLVDALQECTSVRSSIRKWLLGWALCGDKHFERLKNIVPVGSLYLNHLDERPRNWAGEEPSQADYFDRSLKLIDLVAAVNWSA